MPRTYTRRPLIDRIMDKVEIVDGHWIWTGSVGSSGYGHIGAGGRDGRHVLVHRAVWEHHRGPIPDGFQIDHLDHCLRILCCNPECLEPVTHAENQARAARRRLRCRNGHPYTPENTRTTGGRRECRRCHADREREARRRRRAERQERFRDVCSRGHRRTEANTWHRPTGPTCRDCLSESARNRGHHDADLRDSGSGMP